MSFDDDAKSIWIDDFGFEPGDRFHYAYNFHEDIIHDIRVEAVDCPFYLRILCHDYSYLEDQNCSTFMPRPVGIKHPAPRDSETNAILVKLASSNPSPHSR